MTNKIYSLMLLPNINESLANSDKNSIDVFQASIGTLFFVIEVNNVSTKHYHECGTSTNYEKENL